MPTRKAISQSIRWTVFARDGFCCRYCGGQAGEPGIELVVDHIVSVKDGGENGMDNLVTACRGCNAGKSARSLKSIPTPADVVDRITARASNIEAQAKAMVSVVSASHKRTQSLTNLLCEAFSLEGWQFGIGEEASWMHLVDEFGADVVFDWMCQSASRGVYTNKAIMYCCGIARKIREERQQKS